MPLERLAPNDDGDPPDYWLEVCNIGGRDRRRRYRYAGVCGLVAVAYAAGVLVWSAPTALLLGLFVPLSLGVESLLQARRSFCARLGFRGRFDLRDERGTSRLRPTGAAARPTAVREPPAVRPRR